MRPRRPGAVSLVGRECLELPSSLPGRGRGGGGEADAGLADPVVGRVEQLGGGAGPPDRLRIEAGPAPPLLAAPGGLIQRHGLG